MDAREAPAQLFVRHRAADDNHVRANRFGLRHERSQAALENRR